MKIIPGGNTWVELDARCEQSWSLFLSLNDLCAQYPWVFGRITLFATVSVASWSGQTVNAAVVCALPSPHKPLVAALSGNSVLSFSRVRTGFIKMTSGFEISPLWLKDDVIDDKSLLHKKVCGFSSYREPKIVSDTLYQPNFFPAQSLEALNCRMPQKGESGDIAGALWRSVSLFKLWPVCCGAPEDGKESVCW